jgi:hypothetical protein
MNKQTTRFADFNSDKYYQGTQVERRNKQPDEIYSEDLARFDRELAELCRIVGSDLIGMNEVQFRWKPKSSLWSLAEIVEHISRTASLYLVPMRRALDDVQAGVYGSPIPLWLDNALIRLILSLDPPPRYRVPAPKIFRPESIVTGSPRGKTALLREFVSVHESLRLLLPAVEEVDLRRIILVSPVSRVIRFNFRHCYLLLIIHAKRHLWQMERLREQPGFPV